MKKLCRAMAKWGQYISKGWLKMKLTQVSHNTVSPFFLRLAHKFWWHISIGEESLSSQWWSCLCRKAALKGIKSRKIRLPCRKWYVLSFGFYPCLYIPVNIYVWVNVYTRQACYHGATSTAQFSVFLTQQITRKFLLCCRHKWKILVLS